MAVLSLPADYGYVVLTGENIFFGHGKLLEYTSCVSPGGFGSVDFDPFWRLDYWFRTCTRNFSNEVFEKVTFRMFKAVIRTTIPASTEFSLTIHLPSTNLATISLT
jgi:hypothetical protein